MATLVRLLGDIDQAEEALQEAFSAALTVWPHKGIPSNPRAWLISTGKFKGIDAIRRRVRGAELSGHYTRQERTYTVPEAWDGDVLHDDQLRLIFTCCHPELTIDARVALSLRVVCGLTTAEIARSFLVAEETMKKRLSRAKATIREHRIPYEVPSPTRHSRNALTRCSMSSTSSTTRGTRPRPDRSTSGVTSRQRPYP